MEGSKVLIDIKFSNKKTYLAFQEEFVSLVKKYYKSKIDDMNISDDMANNRIRVSEKLVKKNDDFLVDKTPNFKNLKSPDDESTPTYRKSTGKMLTDEKDTSTPSRRSGAASRNACFNCDKDNHSLRDCPEPRNMSKVNKARNEFNRRELRYHDDNDNEYANMIPGTISDELKSALGILSSNQIPLHVYRMRLFGYPPGWIEEAKIHNSGLALFVDKDKKQLQPGLDDGEMEETDFKFDLQKIHDFPGFNVSPDHKYLDLSRKFNTPPMLPEHSKEQLIKSLGENVVNGYKKKKRRISGLIIDMAGDESFSIDKTSISEVDMDIEDPSCEVTLPLGVTVCHGPALPSELATRPPEPMEDGELSNDSRSASPDVDLLAEQRKKILAEIADSSVFLDTSTINTSFDITLNSTASVSLNNSCLNETIIENSENENRDNIAKDTTAFTTENHGQVDETIFGCPVLPSFTPFNALPAGEKFQEGVCDVINFENLAESTGKYEKMKEILTKVRVFQKEHLRE